MGHSKYDAKGVSAGYCQADLIVRRESFSYRKNNQKDLLAQIKDSFSLHVKALEVEVTEATIWEYQCERYEERSCETLPLRQMLLPETLKQWEVVKTLIKIDVFRNTK